MISQGAFKFVFKFKGTFGALTPGLRPPPFRGTPFKKLCFFSSLSLGKVNKFTLLSLAASVWLRQAGRLRCFDVFDISLTLGRDA